MSPPKHEVYLSTGPGTWMLALREGCRVKEWASLFFPATSSVLPNAYRVHCETKRPCQPSNEPEGQAQAWQGTPIPKPAPTKKRWRLVPGDAHEWVSFEDSDEQRTWRFDVTFLLSKWECIYGRGCQGVLTGPSPELEQGCCSYGAHFTDEEDSGACEGGGQGSHA